MFLDCVLGVIVPSYAVGFTYIPGKLGLCLLILYSHVMCAIGRGHSGPMVWPDGIFCLECVSKIKSILSIIFHVIYGAVHIQLTHFSYDLYALYLIIIIKSDAIVYG